MVEEVIRSGRFGATLRLRVDLHGVVVTSDSEEIVFPSGVFGLDPPALAERLEQAGSITRRADVIAELGRTEPGA